MQQLYLDSHIMEGDVEQWTVMLTSACSYSTASRERNNLACSDMNTWSLLNFRELWVAAFNEKKKTVSDVVLCSAPPDGCREQHTTSHLEHIDKRIFSMGIRWLGDRSLHTTRNIAQIIVGVVFVVSSQLFNFCCRGGRLVGHLYGCTERHAFSCRYIKSVRQSLTISPR